MVETRKKDLILDLPKRSDAEQLMDLSEQLYKICGSLDSQKNLIAGLLATWINTDYATVLIQSMAHVDTAIRICEKRHGKMVQKGKSFL